MTTATKIQDSTATGQRFVNAIAHRAWDELATYLDDAVQFRGLTGKGLFSADDRASAARHVQTWFGWLDQLTLLSSEVQPMHDRLHISYRFRASTWCAPGFALRLPLLADVPQALPQGEPVRAANSGMMAAAE